MDKATMYGIKCIKIITRCCDVVSSRLGIVNEKLTLSLSIYPLLYLSVLQLFDFLSLIKKT